MVGLRVRRATPASVTVALCGLSTCFDGVGADEASESSAMPLVIRADEAYPFSAGSDDDLVFSAGRAQPGHECTANEQEAAAALHNLASDSEAMDVRRLVLSRAQIDDSILDGLRPAWAAGPTVEPPELSITNVRFHVMPEGILTMALEFPLPNGSSMDVPADGIADMRVQYDCLTKATATVQLRMDVLLNGKMIGKDLCISWEKKCELGFRSMQVTAGGYDVFTDGVVNSAWSDMMTSEGTNGPVSKFSLASMGITRIRPPTASSNQKLLKVSTRGPFYFNEDFELTKEPADLSVIYTCEYDGFADVTLRFEKALPPGAQHKAEKMEMKWRKNCGATEYKHLTVSIRSEVYKNRTLAVSGGVTLPGYMRPCESSLRPSSVGSDADGCQRGGHLLEVPPKDTRTNLELKIEKDGAMEPPMFQPPPDLTYDRHIMHATVSLNSRTPLAAKSHKSAKPNIQTMSVKYTCFRDGESIVMVTLHVLAHKPIDLAWRKRCIEPKAKVGKAITAPQAIVITVFVFAVIGLISCLVYIACDRASKQAGYEGLDDADAGDMELARRDPARPKPAKLGLDTDGEVTYH